MQFKKQRNENLSFSMANKENQNTINLNNVFNVNNKNSTSKSNLTKNSIKKNPDPYNTKTKINNVGERNDNSIKSNISYLISKCKQNTILKSKNLNLNEKEMNISKIPDSQMAKTKYNGKEDTKDKVFSNKYNNLNNKNSGNLILSDLDEIENLYESSDYYSEKIGHYNDTKLNNNIKNPFVNKNKRLEIINELEDSPKSNRKLKKENDIITIDDTILSSVDFLKNNNKTNIVKDKSFNSLNLNKKIENNIASSSLVNNINKVIYTNTYSNKTIDSVKSRLSYLHSERKKSFEKEVNSNSKLMTNNKHNLNLFYSQLDEIISKSESNKSNMIQIPIEYLTDIYRNLLIEESKFYSISNDSPTYGHFKERAILIDWIIDVSDKFKLREETLFLCINIYDYFINLVNKIENFTIDKDKLQLYLICSLSIACKYEEVFSPEIKDFVYIAESYYPKEEILKNEIMILNKLKFEVSFPSVLTFFDILIIFYDLKNCSNYDNTYKTQEDDNKYKKCLFYNNKCIKFIALYIFQLFSMDSRFLKYFPSIIAHSVFLICLKIVNDEDITDTKDTDFKFTILNEPINKYENFNDVEFIKKNEDGLINIGLKNCYYDILFNLFYNTNIGLTSLESKFSKKKYKTCKEKISQILFKYKEVLTFDDKCVKHIHTNNAGNNDLHIMNHQFKNLLV